MEYWMWGVGGILMATGFFLGAIFCRSFELEKRYTKLDTRLAELNQELQQTRKELLDRINVVVGTMDTTRTEMRDMYGIKSRSNGSGGLNEFIFGGTDKSSQMSNEKKS